MSSEACLVPKLSACFVNTVTDPGVIFAVGNTILNWESAGVAGAILNLSNTVISVGLRLCAEAKKHFNFVSSDTALGKFLDNPASSLKISGYAQLIVAGSAAVNGDFSTLAHALKSGISVAIPLAFGWGNHAAAGSFKKIEERAAKHIGKIPAGLVFKPDIPYAVGLTLASGAAAPFTVPFFAASTASSIYHTAKQKESPVYLHPLAGLTIGNEVSAILNGVGGQFGASAATGLFGVGYASIICQQKYGGVYETFQALGNGTQPKAVP